MKETKTSPAAVPDPPVAPSCPYDGFIGQHVAIRTVTMIDTGILIGVYPNELVLFDAAWIPDTDRWADFVRTGNPKEVEPFNGGLVVVGRGAVIDVCLVNGKPNRTQK